MEHAVPAIIAITILSAIKFLLLQMVFVFSSPLLNIKMLCCTFRGLLLKMQQDLQLKETWMFTQSTLHPSPLLIQVSHLKEYWSFRRSGKPILYPRARFNFLLECYLLLITLLNAWQLEKLGCKRLLSRLQMWLFDSLLHW